MPEWDRLAQLPLLTAVVKESMRILTPVPQQLRVALCWTTLAGYSVPPGARVVLSSLLTNRNPDLYPQPDRFDPSRWERINPSPYEYAVFSAGPRGCPGFWFGLSAVKAALASILLRYRVALVPNARIDYTVRITMKPRRAVPAVLACQDGAFSAAPIRGAVRRLVQFPDRFRLRVCRKRCPAASHPATSAALSKAARAALHQHAIIDLTRSAVFRSSGETRSSRRCSRRGPSVPPSRP